MTFYELMRAAYSPFIAKEQKLIDYYLEMTDAIITVNDPYNFVLETPEMTQTYTDKFALMNDVEYTVNEIRKAVNDDN